MLLLMLCVLAAGVMLTLRYAAFYLAVSQPLGGGVLVVEGWQSHKALKASHDLFHKGGYTMIITTGGPIINEFDKTSNSYAERATEFLLNTGIPSNKIITASAPASAQDRTFLSAVMARQVILSRLSNTSQFDIVTTGVHARRTHTLYRLAFSEDFKLGIIAVRPERFSLEYWWHTSEGTKAVLSEILSLGWVWCCFSPGKPGTREEMWAMP